MHDEQIVGSFAVFRFRGTAPAGARFVATVLLSVRVRAAIVPGAGARIKPFPRGSGRAGRGIRVAAKGIDTLSAHDVSYTFGVIYCAK
jgi:hypothetical protein